jgi:hypothetical protein
METQLFFDFVLKIILKEIKKSNTSNPNIANVIIYKDKYTCIGSYPIRMCNIGQIPIDSIDIMIPFVCYHKISPIIKTVENGNPVHLTDIKPHFHRFVRYDYRCEEF